jgi:AcrR family transcriptional regulator
MRVTDVKGAGAGEAAPGGRERQRRRTRKAIVAAAAGLLESGRSPSVAEVAEAADVSRRTVYLYFPTVEQLLADAALEATRAGIEPQFEASDDPAERIEALVRAMHRSFAETEQLGRTILKHTIGAAAPADAANAPRRGYRRIEWIERALEPLRGTLPAERFEGLVSALALVIGWEAMIALRDTRGLSSAEAEEVCVWAARSLLDAATSRS